MKLFQFGESVKGYDVPVFNEREVRGAAGILFLGAMVAFMNAFLLGNFTYIKMFVVLFWIEFVIRLVINPKYAPIMVVARLGVMNQNPEFSGAPQKLFAWGIGLGLSTLMMYLVIINDVRGSINLAICLLCLTFLFLEAAFGICVGCKIYNLFNKDKAKFCPGGACEIGKKHEIVKVTLSQSLVTLVFGFLIVWLMAFWN